MRASRLGAMLIAAVVVLGGLLPAGGAGPAAGAADRPERYSHIRAQVFTVPGVGRVAVGAPSPRRVLIQRYDDASATWGEPSVLYAKRGVTCGEIDGRTSPGGLALLLECDRPYYEDQAPTHSVALVSRDLRTWARTVLPGEAYRGPGISPDGRHAVWLAGGHGDFVAWSEAAGFAPRRSTTYDNDVGDPTAVVTDAGVVSVIGAGSRGGRCVIDVHSRTPGGSTSLEQVDFAPGERAGCTELRMEGLSSTRAEGVFSGPEDTFVIGRVDETAPWELLRRQPSSAPGLVKFGYALRKRMYTLFSALRDGRLVALGSADRRRIIAQAYDAEAQEWGPARLVHDHGFPGCTWDGPASQATLRVHAVLARCYPQRRADGDYPPYDGNFTPRPRNTVALLSPDGETWRSVRIGRKPVGVSADGALVAAPGRTATYVLSPAGVTRLPGRPQGRCDVVFPIAADGLLRLHGGGERAWPGRLQLLDGKRWRTIQRLDKPDRGECRRTFHYNEDARSVFVFVGPEGDRALTIVRRDGQWRAVRARPF